MELSKIIIVTFNKIYYSVFLPPLTYTFYLVLIEIVNIHRKIMKHSKRYRKEKIHVANKIQNLPSEMRNYVMK